MKFTNKIYDKDQIEIPVYVNGSFAEKLILTGKELNRLMTLLNEPVAIPNGSVVIPAGETINIKADGTTADPLPPDATISNTAGDASKELRKDPEMQAGDATAEKRGD